MIKKLTLALVIFCTIISCGKKGNPEYKDSKIKTEIRTIFLDKA